MTLGRSLRLGSERRSSRRGAVDRVFVHGQPHGGSSAAGRVAAVCVDLSAADCRLHVPSRPPAADAVLGLVFAPHAPDPVLARVVRVERGATGGYDLGLAFERLSTRDRSRLEDWREWWSRSGRRVAPPTDIAQASVESALRHTRLQVLPPSAERRRPPERHR